MTFKQSSASRIEELAKIISKNTTAVNNFITEHDLPQPSFDINGPIDLSFKSDKVEKARIDCIEASIELQDLLQGPISCLRPAINPTSLETIYRYKIANQVPLDGSEISFRDLAEKCRMPEPDLRRILRYAILYHRVFQERREGLISHSAASRILATDSAMYDTLGMMFDESTQAFARTCEAMEKFPSQEVHETAYSLAHCPGKSVWDYYDEHPDRARRFASAMRSLTSSPGQSVEYLANGFPWSSLPQGSKIIDLGGSEGHVSIALAERHKQLKFVVQDLPNVLQGMELKKDLDVQIRDRIEFMAHDFLTKQRTAGDVFLMRWIMHDWPDRYVVRILRNLIPVLKEGNRILINDSVIPGPGQVNTLIERGIRLLDLCMMSFFNSRERERNDWLNLIQEADKRFRNLKIWTPEGASLAIIEATWIP